MTAPMWAFRFGQLIAGLCVFGLGAAFMVRANLGLDPWNVFHQGLSGRLGWSLGTVTILSGVVVMLLWIPLRLRPGLGTLCNIFVIGLSLDAALALLPSFADLNLVLRLVAMGAGVVLTALGSAAYIGAGMGTGPRDGLMMGLNQRFGWSIRVSRLLVELVVLASGWLLGGVAGLGTVAFALLIGPLVQFFLHYFKTPKTRVAKA